MNNDVFIDPSDQYSMQNLPALRDNLKLDPNADANAERKPIIPPSELVMGPGKPYFASVAFVATDPKKRWKYHTHNNKGVPHANPFSGTMIQYTLVNTPMGTYDGLQISEYIMTMTNKNGTCSAMGLLQALGIWNPAITNGAQMIQAIEAALARTPVIGIHVDWNGQRVIDRPQFAGDGKTPLIGPDGQAVTVRVYEDVPGLDSWRGFNHMAPPEAGSKIPASRIERKDPNGNAILDQSGLPIVYSARAEVTRRECVTGQPAAQPTQGFGTQPPPAFMQAPPQQQFMQAPAQQWAPPPQQQYPTTAAPAQQWSAPPPQAQPQWAPPAQQAPAPQPAQQAYQPPAPAGEPWQQGAPSWVTGKA